MEARNLDGWDCWGRSTIAGCVADLYHDLNESLMFLKEKSANKKVVGATNISITTIFVYKKC